MKHNISIILLGAIHFITGFFLINHISLEIKFIAIFLLVIGCIYLYFGIISLIKTL